MHRETQQSARVLNTISGRSCFLTWFVFQRFWRIEAQLKVGIFQAAVPNSFPTLAPRNDMRFSMNQPALSGNYRINK